MKSPVSLSSFLSRAWRVRRRARAMELSLKALAPLASVAAASTALLWATGRPTQTTAAWLWIAALILAGLFAWRRSRLGPKERSEVTQDLDRELAAGGALLAACHVRQRVTPGRFDALVLRAGERFCQGRAPARAWVMPKTCLAAIVTAAAATVLALWASHPANRIEAPAPMEVASGAAAARGVDEEADPPDSESDPGQPNASEMARLEIMTDHQTRLLGEPIWMTVTLKPEAGVGVEVPLEFKLLLADGTESPDIGFGIGVRTHALALPWSLPAEGGVEPLTQRIQLNEILRRVGLERVGVITMDLLAAVPDDAPVGEGLRSNRHTFQISDNRERSMTRKPSPVAQQKSDKSQREDEEPKEEKGFGGDLAPELGERDRAEDVQRHAVAVKPLLADGPKVEKLVDVFDRERGGSHQRPQAPPPIGGRAPARSFLEREEASLERLPLRPVDRRILRRYWKAVRGGE